MSSLSSIYASIEPADLGLPSKFKTFRYAQRESLEWLMDECRTAISAAQLPTGAGKTALAIALSKLLGVKSGYLVATKALQQQVLDDFSCMGLVDIRGRSNYSCPNYGDCDRGYEQECSLRDTSGCARSVAMEKTKRADLFVSNYACWLHSRNVDPSAFETDDRPIGLLICDEAHALESQLTGYAAVHVSADEIDKETRSRLDPYGLMSDSNCGWLTWSAAKVKSCRERKDRLKARHPNDYKRLDAWKEIDELEHKAKRVGSMGANWVWQFDDRTGAVAFEPIYVSGFMSGLFSGVPRVLMMSASLTTFQTNLLLGRDDSAEGDNTYDYRAWNQVFPPQNAPCYHIPTARLTWKSTDEDYQRIIAAMDGVIDSRRGRRQIIQTVSYARSKRALQYSRHANRFIWNNSASELANCLGRFRSGDEDVILVSPSVEEGFNFPGRQCEVQHFIKFPFPNETNRTIKERCNRIPGYRLHAAAQRLYQMCGRARRFDADRCESFIYDNSVAQLKGPEGRSYLPQGFKIYTVNRVPPAPPRAPEGE